MADFTLATASAKEEWSAQYAAEYIRDSALLAYMGTDETSIIRVRNELLGTAGAAVHFPLVQRLRGAGVTGGSVLYGAEEAQGNYSDCVRTSLIRNAVMITEDQSYKTEIDLYNAGRASLKNWSAEKLRDDVITALGSVIVRQGGSNGEDSAIAFETATPTQRDVHFGNNSDRVLFGTNNGNKSATGALGGASPVTSASVSFANSALNVTAGMTMSAAILLKAKTLAKKAGAIVGTSHIAPFKSDMTKGQEYFVLFVGSEGFRDLSADATINAANTYARGREGNAMDSNPLFQDGDLLYRGIIIREVPEMPLLSVTGAASAPLAQAFLCGQSAVAVAWSKKPNPRTQQFDYGHRNGAGISEIRGQKKVSFNGSQYGVVTLVHSAPSDA